VPVQGLRGDAKFGAEISDFDSGATHGFVPVPVFVQGTVAGQVGNGRG